MFRRLTRLRKVLVCWCAAVFVWGWVPIFTDGKMSVGVLIPVLIAPTVAAWLVATPPLSQAKGRIKGMLIASVVVACVAAVLAGMVCGLMAHAAAASPRDGATVIVLGAKIHGDQPSRMLRQRFDEAADRLSEDPTARCVVIGGLGEAVAALLCEHNMAVPMARVGVQDVFGTSGTAKELMKAYGLTSEQIVQSTKTLFTSS